MTAPRHIPVMLEEVVRFLAPCPGEVYLDCTAGLGGHAAAVAALLEPRGTVILNDADPTNLERAAEAVRAGAPHINVRTIHGNFAELPHRLAVEGLAADMVLADLGFASSQMEDAERGFSFSADGPLDMRLNPDLRVTAADLIASLPEAELADLIGRYGEDRNARRIARKLVQSRALGPIVTTARLAEIVRSASPRGGQQIDPATRTFQALRIAVNDEVGSLEALLGSVVRETESLSRDSRGAWLAAGARVALISFHSLEDRPIKQALRRLVGLGATDLAEGPVTPGESELAANPRSRSAKLRVARLPGTTMAG